MRFDDVITALMIEFVSDYLNCQIRWNNYETTNKNATYMKPVIFIERAITIFYE
ncbi:MAG: hypothetical protein ACPKPY_03125 [Nitrososphaeraceae archaeon]